VGDIGRARLAGRARLTGTAGRAAITLFVSVFFLAFDLPGLPGPPDLRAQRAASGAAQPKEKPPKSRLFKAQDLGLLESPDRDQWQKPDQIMDALGIAEGNVVAELGAAGGWFTQQVARRVGPNGVVYAEDIQPPMLEAISRRMRNENLTNVKTVLGTASDPRLPVGIDAILISDAFHEMDEPADPMLVVRLLKNAAESLKPQGRLGVVDWTPGGGGPGPAANQRANPDVVIAKARAAGLQLLQREDIPPFVYLLVFGRTTS
jgi:SAM-dependent methyltransferase